MRRSWLWWLLIPMAMACGNAVAVAKDAPRLALVVGNAGYRSGALPTAANDAGLIAQTLAQVGFDVVAARDTDAATLRKAVSAFVDDVRLAGPDAIVFVYLSGYGVQFAGENFVVPVDAQIDRQADVPATSVPLAELQSAIEALPAQARIFAYDLARDNQIAIAEPVPLAGGLTLVRAPRGSLYAFNAAPGTVAHATLPPYGLYARALAEVLRTPGLTVQAMFARIRLRVAEVTGGAVVPWDDAGLDTDLTLLAPVSGLVTRAYPSSTEGLPEEAAFWTAIAQDDLATYQAFVRAFGAEGLAARIRMMIAVRLEAATWSESVRANVPAAYWSYMQRYPRGPHYVDVRRRLAAIHAALEPPSRFDPYVFADVPMPSPDQVRSIGRQNLSFDDPDGPPMPRVPDELLPPAPAATDLDLAPPPLVPVGVMPVPFPLLTVATTAWRATPRPIRQPFVPDQGLVTIDSAARDDGVPSMTLSTEAGMVTRAAVALEKDQRTIVQINAADEIMSRTSVTQADGSLVRITQTDSRGDLLGEMITHINPLGERLTTVSDGRHQLIGEVRADRRGVMKELTRGTGVWSETTFVLPPLQTRPTTEVRPAVPSIAAPAPPPAMPPVMPALERPAAPPLVAPPPSTGLLPVKPADVSPLTASPPPLTRPEEQPPTPMPASRPASTPSGPAAVPLPVPRPPQAALRPHRGAVPSRSLH